MKFRAFVLDADEVQMDIMDIDLTPTELEELRAITADYLSNAARTRSRRRMRDEPQMLSDDPTHETKLFH